MDSNISSTSQKQNSSLSLTPPPPQAIFPAVVKKQTAPISKKSQQIIKTSPSLATSKPSSSLKQAQPSLDKEQVSSSFKEGEPMVIEKKEFEPAPEVQPWVSKVKTAEEITLPLPIKDEFGQILMQASAPVKPKIVLPLSQPKIKAGLHQKMAESVRWLAEWCWRLIKMFPKRVGYESNK